MSARKIAIWSISILSVLLIIWLAASYYLFTQAQTLVYEIEAQEFVEFESNRLNFERVTVSNADNESIEILVIEKWGAGESDKTYLYLHGNVGRLEYILNDLSAFGDVISPAYPGYHLSEGSPDTKKIYEAVDLTINYLINEKGLEPSDIIVLGHSLGGNPSIYAATQYPDLDRVILVNTFYNIQKMCEREYSILCTFSGSIHNTAKIAPNTQTIIRHFHNQNDDHVPFEQGEDLYQRIGSDDKKFFDNIDGTHGVFNVEDVVQKSED